MILKRNLILFLFIFLCTKCDSESILGYFPLPSISHQVVFRTVTQELSKNHNVTVLTTDPMYKNYKSPENFTEIDLHDVSYELWRKQYINKLTIRSHNFFESIEIAYETFLNIFEKQFTIKEVQEIIKKKYDLILVEASLKFALVLQYILKKPVIQISSFGAYFENYEIYGAPVNYMYPDSLMNNVNFNHTFMGKISTIIDRCRYMFVISKSEYKENEALKRTFGDNVPSSVDLWQNMDLFLLNVHRIWDNNRPVPPAMIYLGGIHLKPEKKLPNDLQQYLDNSVEGVIYMSFGTNVNTSALPKTAISVFNKVFNNLNYDVLWKWDDNNIDKKGDNIKLFKWLPQSDILRHPKIKLFITQGGLQSTDEAIQAGVPLLAFPLVGDQWYNAEMIKKLNIGEGLHLHEIDEETLKATIETIIHDPSYRANINRLRYIIQDQPQTSLERAIWWSEYVLRHGGARHLRSPSAGVSWIDYLLIDVFVMISFISAFTVVIFTTLYKIMWKNVQSYSKPQLFPSTSRTLFSRKKV